MIDTDTRQLRRLQDDTFTTGAGKLICSHCGHLPNCTQAMAQDNRCGSFMPTIPFQGEVGMDRVFNTIRVGKAWPKRLFPGQTIALYDVQEQMIIGHASAIFTDCGAIERILYDHAHNNHLMLQEPKREAAITLLNWLKRNYGPRIVNKNTTLTAIYLVRSRSAPDTPVLEGVQADRSVEAGLPHQG